MYDFFLYSLQAVLVAMFKLTGDQGVKLPIVGSDPLVGELVQPPVIFQLIQILVGRIPLLIYYHHSLLRQVAAR